MTIRITLFSTIFSFIGLTTSIGQPAVNLNTELLSKINPRGSGHSYANVWGYAANGREYALLGADDGTSIIDVTDPALPKVVAHIPGPESQWRELRTYQHYAYVVTEGGSPENLIGVHIIDLSALPNSATLVKRYVGRLNHGTVHTVSIDGKYLYLNGARNNSSLAAMNLILDLTDPVNPVEVGAWEQNYWHDSQSKNDTIFASAIYGDGIQIIDARDKKNLKLISQTNYPANFTHNIWMTDDNKFITQTDEEPNMPLNFWDVSDVKNLKLVSEYLAGKNAMAHNAHTNGNLVHVAYYEDGYRVFDISNRKAPVCVGSYDVDGQLSRFGSFTSVWGVYPYLPSGNILLSDIERGLVIVKLKNTTPGYIQGVISDQFDQPIPGVKISYFTSAETDEKITVWSDENGNYSIGANAGSLALTLEKDGYDLKTTNLITFTAGSSQNVHFSLRKRFLSSTTIKVLSAGSISTVGLPVTISNRDFTFSGVINESGEFLVTLPEGSYNTLISGNKIYGTGRIDVFTNDPQTISVQLKTGYFEPFSTPANWKVKETGDKSLFSWKQEKANLFNSIGSLPAFDGSGDYANQAMFSRARRSGSTPNNPGTSSLTSPVFDLANISDPAIRFLKFYHPPVELGEVNDTLKIFLSGDEGATWILAGLFSSPDEIWSPVTYSLTDFGITGSTIQIKFVNIEGVDAFTGANVRPSSWAGIDNVEISSKGNLVSVTPELQITGNEFTLFPAYPNPFNPSTTLKWNQPESSPVTFSVYNSLGQLVKSVSAGTRTIGLQTHSIDFTGFPSGVYFYRIQSHRSQSATGKLILVK
ncbi:MAG: choice-of-anchor B family protein [Bacteroidetes bacterium]|nr:choice-of-anchor B family protein [Bacteroidota bacterium]